MAAIDSREALRFMISGGVATAGNLAAVMAGRLAFSYDVALLCGIGVGMTLSFLLSKFFVFRARAWASARGEAVRFSIVYGAGLVVYYLAAVQVRGGLLFLRVPSGLADMGGVLVGAGLMVVTGYFGHRYFTYRTHRSEGA